MNMMAVSLAAGVMISGICATVSSAAPLMPSVNTATGTSPVEQIAYRRHHQSKHHHRDWRRHHIRNSMRHGHPNSRNPALPGHAQPRGGTAGGPHY